MDYSGQQTFILGSNKLQLELTSTYIAKKINVSCTVVPDLNAIPCGAETKHLILCDCKAWKDSLNGSSEPVLNKHLSHNFLVLINLVNTMGIESEALSQGVRGFLYEQDGTDILLKMIHTVLGSELWVPRNVMAEYIQTHNKRFTQGSNTSLGLTSREVEILKAINQGRSNGMIAEKLCISPYTVKAHIYHIFKKINVSSRVQAVHWSAQHLQ